MTVAKTNVFLGPGTNDANVDVTLGKEVHDILERMSFPEAWKDYEGLDEEGHWLKVGLGLHYGVGISWTVHPDTPPP
jgi:hypothetical protein